MGQDASVVPNISIGDFILEVVENFTSLGSIVSNNLSLEAEIGKRIGKAVSVMSGLCKRVCENDKLTTNTYRSRCTTPVC